MKTIVLMGLSVLLLAGVFCILSKESQASNVSPFSQSFNATETEKIATDLSSVNSENKIDTSNLNDSHWLDDEAFQKAIEGDLFTEEQTQTDIPGQKVDGETIHSASPKREKAKPVTEPVPTIRQLILELDADTTTAQKAVHVEVV